mmetsp:Transcript_27323/g.22969  ORF Transcript_27323/g.22969 Transcript_27323/m.22969 type:complete len:189 (-) Transcript_27323:191-757(-)
MSVVSATQDCKSLLATMLEKDHKKRISSTQALFHDWFKGDTDSSADLISGGSNKSAVAAVISNLATSNSLNRAVKAFHCRMCNSVEDIKKLKGAIGEPEKDKKLDRDDFQTICKKLNEHVRNDDVDDMCDAFSTAGGIKGGELLTQVKLSIRENNFAMVEFIFQHNLQTYGSVTVDIIKKFLNESDFN